MTSEGGALEHVEETSKLYRETTVPVEIKQPTAGGYLRVSNRCSRVVRDFEREAKTRCNF